MSEPIRVIPQRDLVDADPTPGMRRKRAVDAPGCTCRRASSTAS
jgi:hypothetical protein